MPTWLWIVIVVAVLLAVFGYFRRDAFPGDVKKGAGSAQRIALAGWNPDRMAERLDAVSGMSRA